MSKYIVDDTTMTGIADAVREMRMHSNEMTPEEIVAEIKKIHTGEDINYDINAGRGEWVRPQDWPNLDSIDIPNDFDGVYMTYDLRKTRGYGWIGIRVNLAVNTTFTIERGHLENGAFVADFSTTQARNTYFREALDEANGLVQLWRVYSEGQITQIGLAALTATAANNLVNGLQPMVERRGYLPYLTNASSSFSSNGSYLMFGSCWLERDNVDIGRIGVVTTLYSTYGNCYNLRSANLNWKTDHWRVTSISYMFQYCYRLAMVDFSSWNTSNWAVVAMASTFAQCCSLEELNLGYWNTSNWTVTNIANLFDSCVSLEKVDGLDRWDTSGWAVTNMATLFQYCFCLKEFDSVRIGWDTSNWAVTNASSIFQYCPSIVRIDLSGWNTSNWAVTTINGLFRECRSLKEANVTLDTSNWVVTSISYLFNYCESIREIDLSSWDTSKWVVTGAINVFSYCYNLQELCFHFDTSGWFPTSTTDNTISNMFLQCRGLKSLDLSDWDTTSWKLKNAGGMFNWCCSLTEIVGLSDFVTKNWILTAIDSMFANCASIEHFDLSGWDTSNWALTTISSMFAGCRNLIEIDSIKNWDTSNWELTTLSCMFQVCSSLREVDLSSWDTTKWKCTSVYYCIDGDRNLKTMLFPDTLDLSLATNANYIITEQTTIEECNFYVVPKTLNMTCRGTYSYTLSKQSLLTLISKLPIITATRTLNLQQTNLLKLTPEEIAIATQKGWTVA